ncbi:MAG: hypothetical protein LBN41_09640 [Enterobacteriaceae bacterium]|jgi:hypothetical protein|nr:hypothetical protein [Enterobacteriaceae bacterium]
MRNQLTDLPESYLRPEELAYQCIALTKSAIDEDAATREALLFILMEKTTALYAMLTDSAEVSSE